jgi:hypothetical protein
MLPGGEKRETQTATARIEAFRISIYNAVMPMLIFPWAATTDPRSKGDMIESILSNGSSRASEADVKPSVCGSVERGTKACRLC